MLLVDKKKCDECGACISVCKSNALLLAETLEVNEAKCISCGACIRICPFAALHPAPSGACNA